MASIHGTWQGWWKHHRTGVPACAGCSAAKVAYTIRRRNKGKCAKGLGWPLVSARELGRG